MAVLGIDYGSKRIGLALSDSETKLARPFMTIANDDSLLHQLGLICSKESIDTIVVGLPRGLDGQDTAQTQITQRFVDTLKAHQLIPVKTIDEAVTSELAKEKLGKDAKVEDIDMHAAAIILQDYLDEGQST